MTDEQIMKALECCDNGDVKDWSICVKECPYQKRCYDNENNFIRDVIGLVNRQKETIQNQGETIRAFTNAQETLLRAIGERDKEIERLKSGHILYDDKE